MIILRAIKRYKSCISIEQTLFKQIVTGDKVLDLVHLSFLEKLLCICTIGFCDQSSSWSSSCGWTKELCSQQSFQIGDWSRILGSAQLVSHILRSRASERGTVTIEQVRLGIGVRDQLQVGKILGIPYL